jgi:hypothetical protein
MGLNAMAPGLREQMEQSQYHEFSFEERLGLLVDREASWRENRRLATRLKAAKMRHQRPSRTSTSAPPAASTAPSSSAWPSPSGWPIGTTC